MHYEVRKCCDEMPHYMYVIKGIEQEQRIDMEQDDYSDLEDVKYCMYCGNRLQLQLVPDKPPAELDLSSLSAKDRALEELRIKMEAEQQK